MAKAKKQKTLNLQFKDGSSLSIPDIPNTLEQQVQQLKEGAVIMKITSEDGTNYTFQGGPWSCFFQGDEGPNLIKAAGGEVAFDIQTLPGLGGLMQVSYYRLKKTS